MENSVDPDQTPLMRRLMWVYTVSSGSPIRILKKGKYGITRGVIINYKLTIVGTDFIKGNLIRLSLRITAFQELGTNVLKFWF